MILHKDSVVALESFSDNTFDLTVTSPPYDNLRDYKSLEWGDHIWKPVISELYRITKSGGVVVWIVGDATIKGSETGTSFKQALYFKEIEFNLHDTMIWDKGNFTSVGSLKTRYAPVFEYMFILVKGQIRTFNPIKDRINKSFGRKTSGTIRQKDGRTKPLSKIGNLIPEYGQRHNIWRIHPEKNSKKLRHPAVFPESLAHDHIISWSNPGDLVLDPFCGSGTTGKMALQLGRRFIGIEKEKEYVEIARKRIKPFLPELFK